jgi:hypothetical protein
MMRLLCFKVQGDVSMSADNQLDSADKRKMNEAVPHHHVEWTDIGTAEVSVDLFGHAKVHVIHEHDHTRRNWLIAGLSLAVMVVAIAGYMLSGKDESVPAESPTNLSQQSPTPVIVPQAVPVEVLSTSNAAPAVKPPAKPRAAVSPSISAAPAPLVDQPVQIVKPAAVHKPKPVVTDGTAPPVSPAALASPIQSSESNATPSKPQGVITY